MSKHLFELQKIDYNSSLTNTTPYGFLYGGHWPVFAYVRVFLFVFSIRFISQRQK